MCSKIELKVHQEVRKNRCDHEALTKKSRLELKDNQPHHNVKVFEDLLFTKTEATRFHGVYSLVPDIFLL
jgi:hypothetical protein